MEEACRREGHPDNVAACWLGGMTVSAHAVDRSVEIIATATLPTPANALDWKLLLVASPRQPRHREGPRPAARSLHAAPTPSPTSRAPPCWSPPSPMGRADLLRTAMQDRIHQPYRMAACPLLPLLLPLAGNIRGIHRS